MSISDYIFAQIGQTIAHIKFFMMFISVMLTITMVFATYWIVNNAISLPAWVAIWITVASFCYWQTHPKAIKASALHIDDFVVIKREKDLAEELVRLLASVKVDTMRIAETSVPIYDYSTLINQVD